MPCPSGDLLRVECGLQKQKGLEPIQRGFIMRTIMRLPRFSMRHVLFSLTFLAAAATPLMAQEIAPAVIVFGDSLSDPGNGFAFVKTNATPPDYGLNAFLIPSSPYARGGHHLSNGETWIEQLARSLGAERSVLPAFASANPHAMNFAIGTARARDDGINPSLSFEVAAFLQKTGGQVRSDALIVIEVGGNDVRDAVATGNPAQALAILQAAANAVRDTITLLHARGAQRFLVWNVPNAGLTPAASLSGTTALATLATTTFNALLVAALTPLQLAGIEIIPFDANALITAIVAAPQLYGLTNVVDACVTPGTAPFTCQTPDEYLFWDGIHPTKAGHELIAQAVALLLGAV
jgi:phospholipase/lecithinase/hemolysin